MREERFLILIGYEEFLLFLIGSDSMFTFWLIADKTKLKPFD